MIKPSLSLKSSILLAFATMVVLVVVGYSALSYTFFFRGMDSIMSANMEKALQLSLEQQAETGVSNPIFYDYVVTTEWQQQPKALREAFGSPPDDVGKLHLKSDKVSFYPSKVMHFLIALENQGQRYFVSYKGEKEKASPLLGKNAKESKQILFGVSFAASVLLILLVWALLRKVSRPMKELTDWTHHLSPEKLTVTPPDFVYPELNEMAQLIQRSLSSVNDSLQREQDFLRFTSHELRTPISVIRNNIELFRKLNVMPEAETKEKRLETIDRIDRASLTMRHLTEVLLWLGREDIDALPHQQCELDSLIQTTVDELSYLLNNKPVTVELQLTPEILLLPVTAVQIVIGNLVRNAFQHTWDGRVVIQQSGADITISNHCQQFRAEPKQDQLGFGLGLRLTEALCQKLNWPYRNEETQDGHDVKLTVLQQQ